MSQITTDSGVQISPDGKDLTIRSGGSLTVEAGGGSLGIQLFEAGREIEPGDPAGGRGYAPLKTNSIVRSCRAR